MLIQSVSLKYQDARSHKGYNVTLEQVGDDLYSVNFNYGRIGKAFQSGTKTAQPVDLNKAQSIFDKLVKSKVAKGYRQCGTADSSITHLCEKERWDYTPLLLESTTARQAQSLIDNGWIVQRKYDGERGLFQYKDGAIQQINKKGFYVAGNTSLINSLPQDQDEFIIDCEVFQEHAYIFDVIKVNGNDIADMPYSMRYELMKQHFSHLENFTVVESFVGNDAKNTVKEFEQTGFEGVVLKDPNAPYYFSRSGSYVKLKFTKSVSAVVARHNDGKRSVAVQVFDDANPIDVGNVTIPVNHPIPDIGQVIEIEYLYATSGNILYQPIYKGQRNDVSADECRLSELEYTTH